MRLAVFLLALLLLALPAQAAVTLLPVEVLGTAQHTETVNVTVPAGQGAGVTKLWLYTHNLSYADKGSVQVNGGSWINLNNTTATVLSTGKDHGGIGGAFTLLKLTVPVTGVVDGTNTIRFRFNQSDGHSSGYRVLEFNLQTAASVNVLPPTEFKTDNPATWTPPLDTPEDIAAGGTFYNTANLVDADGIPMNAKCVDCHMAGGRDLKFFNYSNQSIRAQTMIRGGTQLQADQVASWVRSQTTAAPVNARPWNPPLQPGPGLDSQPIDQWYAGAGHEAILANDKDTFRYIFGRNWPRQANWRLIRTARTLNVREIPIALQLPDWNQWLPRYWPGDTYGDNWLNSNIRRRWKGEGTGLAHHPNCQKGTVTITGSPTGGTFKIQVTKGATTETTSTIPYNEGLVNVRTALRALTNTVGSAGALVGGPNGGPWTLTFSNGVGTVVVVDSALTGGTVPIATYATTTNTASTFNYYNRFITLNQMWTAGNKADWPYWHSDIIDWTAYDTDMGGVSGGTDTSKWSRKFTEQIYSVRIWEMVRIMELALTRADWGTQGVEAYGATWGEDRTWVVNLDAFRAGPFQMRLPSNPNGVGGTGLMANTLSNMWYHVQLIVNASHRQQNENNPIDWPYNYGKFYDGFVGKHTGVGLPYGSDFDGSGRAELARMYLWMVKALQTADSGEGSDDWRVGWAPNGRHHFIPGWFIPASDTEFFVGYTADEQRILTEAIVRTWFEVEDTMTQASHISGGWIGTLATDHPFGTQTGGGSNELVTGMSTTTAFSPGQKLHATLPYWKAMGIDQTLLDAIVADAATKWDNASNNWPGQVD